MLKLENKDLEYYSYLFITIFLFLFLYFLVTITYDVMNFRIFSIALTICGFIAFVLYFMSKKNNLKFNKIEKIIFGLMFLSILSLIGTRNYSLAFFGSYERGEGLLVILSYYALALLTSTLEKEIYKKRIIYMILGIGLLNIIYGLFQTKIINQSIIPIMKSWRYSRGLCNNSMYCAALLSICYPLLVGFFVKTKNHKESIVSFLFVIIFTVGILNTGSMAVFLSSMLVLMLLLILVIYDLVKKHNKENKDRLLKAIMTIIIFVIVTILFQNNNSYLNSDVKELFSQASEVTMNNKVEETYGTGRIHIWKETLPKVKENWLFGVGIDNYKQAYDTPVIDVATGLEVDKAHNEYLHKAMCEGIFSSICYIIFLLIIFFKNIKTEDKYMYGLFLGFTSYCIQAFFSISVIQVVPILFIVIGLLIGNIYVSENKK